MSRHKQAMSYHIMEFYVTTHVVCHDYRGIPTMTTGNIAILKFLNGKSKIIIPPTCGSIQLILSPTVSTQ